MSQFPNLKTIDETIMSTITGLMRFTKERITVDMVQQAILGDVPNPTPIVEDGSTYKEQGCHGGPCACTGGCKQLVPFTAIDLLLHHNYTNLHKMILPKIQKQLELVYGKNEDSRQN